MKKILLLSLVCVAFYGCDNSLKEKELALKERELNLREKELELKLKEENKTNATSKKVAKKETRRLRYLYFANGGLVGYFNDGTIAGCPRCDLAKVNIEYLYSAESHAKYTIKNGCLLIDDEREECPKMPTNTSDGWAMIDYNWNVRVSQ